MSKLEMAPDEIYALSPGALIKEWLGEQGKTQEWLAEEMDMTRSYINRIINGKEKLTFSTAKKLEGATGMKAQVLLHFEQDYQIMKDDVIAGKIPCLTINDSEKRSDSFLVISARNMPIFSRKVPRFFDGVDDLQLVGC